MAKRPFKAGERHHWWPQSLSKNWANSEGLITESRPNTGSTTATPLRAARISDGHNIKVGDPWNTTFEEWFDRPDSEFPRIVQILEKLRELDQKARPEGEARVGLHILSDEDSELLCECLVSLAVRSPKFRAQAMSVVTELRGSVPKPEYKALSAGNIHQTYGHLRRNIGAWGKYLVIYSGNQEFIFGDGFYNNLSPAAMDIMGKTILVPLTPNMSVALYSVRGRPGTPNVATIEATADLVSLLNMTVQIYSKDCLYSRSQPPELLSHFMQNEYLVYESPDPVQGFLDEIKELTSRY